MAELESPAYLQNSCITARGDRLVLASIVCTEGVAHLDDGDLLVTDGPSGLQVVVAAGSAFVAGTEIANQGMYQVFNDASVTLTPSASDPSDDRIDLIVARVHDSEYSGALDEWDLEVVTGTASPAPAPPSLPANSLALAQVLIPAGSTTTTTITDVRTPSHLCVPFEVTAFSDDAAINVDTPVDDTVGPGGTRAEDVVMVYANPSVDTPMLVHMDIQGLIAMTSGVGDNASFGSAVYRAVYPAVFSVWSVFATRHDLPGGIWQTEANTQTDHVTVPAGDTVTVTYQIRFSNTGGVDVTLNKIGIRARGLLLTQHV